MKIIASHSVPVATRTGPIKLPGGRAPNFPPNNPSPTPVGTPIGFFDSIVVQANGDQAFKSRAFQNNTKTPIEIHSMSVSVKLPTDFDPVSGAYIVGTAAVGIQAAVGKAEIPMTRGFVPAWMLAPSDNRRNESTGGSLWVTPMTMKFSSPVTLLPGEWISVQAKHFGYISLPATVYVAFAGRRVPRAAGVQRVPYVMHWQGRSFGYAEAATIDAPPAALANDTKRSLDVERIIGRFVSFEAKNGTANTPSLNDFATASNQEMLTSVRLALSNNRPVLQKFAPWLAVFGNNAAIECDFAMPPGDYLAAGVQHTAGPTLVTTSPYFTGQPFISVVGSREV